MFQPTERVAKVVVEGVYGGQTVENIFYVQVAEAITGAMLEEIAGIFATWVADHMLGYLVSNYEHVRIVATDQTTSPGLQFINIDNAGNAGEQTGASMPQNATFALHRNTGLSGKAAKSRVYWPTLLDAWQAAIGFMAESTANALVDLLETLRIAVEAGTEGSYTYGYISRVLNGALRSSGLFVPVTGHSYTDLALDSQRRRLPARGI